MPYTYTKPQKKRLNSKTEDSCLTPTPSHTSAPSMPPSFNTVVAYEDVVAAKRAKEICDRLRCFSEAASHSAIRVSGGGCWTGTDEILCFDFQNGEKAKTNDMKAQSQIRISRFFSFSKAAGLCLPTLYPEHCCEVAGLQ